MFETYSESAQGVLIAHDRAMREIASHGLPMDTETMADLYSFCGQREIYDASDVLAWLGY